ncbi:MAG: glycogen synthase [Candidatus Aureabacteria bacterium]|nr:glycogen synthase [Candidatus Auribacterota bacterium]
MKVYFFTNEFPPNIYGGAGVHVDYLSRELSKKVSLHVRCFGSQDVHQDSFSVKGVEAPSQLLKNIPKSLSSVFSAFYQNLGFFNSFSDAQIVHCHTWYSHLAGIMAKLAYGIPLVVTTHSLEPLRPWKREQLGGGYDVTCWIERETLRLADAIIAVSRSTKKDILDHFAVPEEKIHVISNGIDTNEYQPVPEKEALIRYGIDPNQKYLLYVGRITRQKGIIHLARAISKLDPDMQVVFCAGAPDTPEIKKELDEAISEIKKTRKNIVWITENLDHRCLIQIYSHAYLFCCPSVYEPFGIINLEAMACGVPVVGTKVGGITEIIIDGETGVLVPLDADAMNRGSQEETVKFSGRLSDAINSLYHDSNLRSSMAEKSRKRAVEVYNWNNIADQVVKIYKSLLS